MSLSLYLSLALSLSRSPSFPGVGGIMEIDMLMNMIYLFFFEKLNGEKWGDNPCIYQKGHPSGHICFYWTNWKYYNYLLFCLFKVMISLAG